MNLSEALDLLSEDVLGDLKRKLKGQVSRADTIKRVAKQELQSSLAFAEVVRDLSDSKRDEDLRTDMAEIGRANKKHIQALKKALKGIDRIK
jgi:hypothetical protein